MLVVSSADSSTVLTSQPWTHACVHSLPHVYISSVVRTGRHTTKSLHLPNCFNTNANSAALELITKKPRVNKASRKEPISYELSTQVTCADRVFGRIRKHILPKEGTVKAESSCICQHQSLTVTAPIALPLHTTGAGVTTVIDLTAP